MRPVDLYALPGLASDPWYDSHGPIGHFFDDEGLEYDLEREAARQSGDARLAFERKLFHGGDGERTVSYYAVTFDGTPFGILVLAGRGGRDQVNRLVTRIDLYREAKAYLESRREREVSAESNLVDPQAEIDLLAGTYGHQVLVGPDGATRLVPVAHVWQDRIVFDEIVFRTALNAHVHKDFTVRSPEFAQGLRGERMAAAASAALLTAIPSGLRASAAFDRDRLRETRAGKFAWVGVLATDGVYAFAVGVPGYRPVNGFAWTSAIEIACLGGCDLYAELVTDGSASCA